jgi:PRTRC genetic system protein E
VFEELMPILTERVLVVTVSRVRADEICINVIPKPLKSEQDNNAALTTPLSVTGTPKELDEQLPRQLVEFVETHLGLSSTLKSAKEQMEAAAKAAREAAKKQTSSKSHSGFSRSTTLSAAKVQTESDTKESSNDSASTPEQTQPSTASAGDGDGASTGSLFDLQAKNDA